MKHIKTYKIYESNGSKLTKEDIISCFQAAFDYSESHGIDTIYFDVNNTREIAHNDFSNKETQCDEGFELSFEHKFWGDYIEISYLDTYMELLTEIKSGVNFLKEKYNVRDVFFTENNNSIITIIICP